MATNRIVLFYGFAPVIDPQTVMMWQRELAERWELRGRVIISEHGINATLGGTVQNLKRYVKTTRQYPGFKGIDVKWSDGTGEDFPRLSVKVRDELVAFGAPGEVEVTEDGVVGGGEHLAPEQLHDLVENRGEEVVFFDGRNAFEAQTGKFKNAVVPDVSTTHGFLDELDSGKYDHLKDKAIVTYCTGGVRCEILTVLMKNRGFKDVYQLDGGIVRYGEKFGSKGLWEGSLYVFDARGEVKFDAQSESIGHCLGCGETTARFANCADDACTTQRLMCESCEQTGASGVPTICATCESLRPAASHS